MEFHKYFQSYEDYFWHWEEEAEVIGIPGGHTIAYREYIIEILNDLQHQGLPPFGSLLLAVVATNPHGKEDIAAIFRNFEALLPSLKLRYPEASNIVESSRRLLDLLSSLPQIYKESKRRIMLLQSIFADCHNMISPLKARKLLKAYTTNQHGEGIIYRKQTFNISVYLQDLKTIALLAEKYPDANSLIEKVADLPDISVSVVIDEENLDVAPSENFLEELIANSKTFHVGSLVKHIWSGLNIPYHNVLPSQQPIGGVSDLTNKGQLDRLLISEFANDDLMFLSRLANNEALYLNREIPPQNNELERVVLIDVSIKNWGTPKTIAFAILAAIAHHPKTDIHCSAFAIGDNVYPLQFHTINEVIDSLDILEPTLHPANGISQYFQENKSGANREVIFISSRDSMRQPALVKVLQEFYSQFKYWIYTDNEGSVHVYKRQQNSKKFVQHLRLPLEEAWSDPKVLNSESFAINSYPILFPGGTKVKTYLKTEDGGIFQINSERCLLRLENFANEPAKKGWQMIYENLPFAVGNFEISGYSGNFHLLMFNPQLKELVLLDIQTEEKCTGIFADHEVSMFHELFFYNGDFYVIDSKDVKCVVRSGSMLSLVSEKSEKGSVIRAQLSIRKHELQKIAKELSTRQMVLKNIRSVYINEVDNLVLNSHELRLTDMSVIKMDQTEFKTKMEEAQRISEGNFVFDNGSKLTVHRSGMILLIPEKGETIYIPSILNSALAAGTANEFTGNSFYQFTGVPNVKPKTFWKKHVESYIRNIRNHGA
jgi:hypothetical protein